MSTTQVRASTQLLDQSIEIQKLTPELQALVTRQQVRVDFLGTSGQTLLSNANFVSGTTIEVYRNGVLLNSSEYSLGTGNISLVEALFEGEQIAVFYGDTTPPSQLSDHGALIGLTDDDHSQYALADGSRGNFATVSHVHSKADVGLGNVDNTSDANKPISTATQSALDLKAPLASPTFTGTVSGVTKAMVGLGNVDNTSDADKPVSTATQTALNLKLDSSSYTAADVLTKIKTVDGANSGLDADLLDGNNSSYFAVASDLSTHTSDATIHLTSAQNTWIDSITATAAEVNYLSGATSNIQSQLGDKEATANKGVANGYAPLNASTKLDTLYLPDSIVGQLEYQGVWNANTNSPTIPAASSSNKGFYYVTSVDGTTTVDGVSDWKVGDWIVSNGTAWDKVDNTDAVSSVNGRLGAITLSKSDVGLSNVDNTSDANKPISTATQSALDLKAPLASPTFTGTVSGITAAMVGLGNVQNVDQTNASNLSSGTVATDRLGTETADSTTFLRGDNTWTAAGASLSTATTETTLYLGLSANTTGAWTSAKVDTNLFYDASTDTLNSVNFNSTSDERLKTSIETIESSLSKIQKLRGVSFIWNKTDKKSYGVIAQELEQVIPELVAKNNIENGLEDQRSVNYDGLIGFLIEAIKEQQTQIDILKQFISGV